MPIPEAARQLLRTNFPAEKPNETQKANEACEAITRASEHLAETIIEHLGYDADTKSILNAVVAVRVMSEGYARRPKVKPFTTMRPDTQTATDALQEFIKGL